MYYFISYFTECTIPLKQLLIADCASIVAKDGLFLFSIMRSLQFICDVTLKRVTGIVTPYSSIVLAHANWRKAIFIRE